MSSIGVARKKFAGRRTVGPGVVVGFGAVEGQVPVDVDIVAQSRHQGGGGVSGDADAHEDLGELGIGGRVDRYEAEFVLQGEGDLAKALVRLAAEAQDAVPGVVQGRGAGADALLGFQDEAAAVHAVGCEQVEQRRLGAAAVEFGLQHALGAGGVVDVGARDAVDVGGDHGECDQRPERGREDEAFAFGHR